MSIPGATYRLQLNAGFTLSSARQVVPYLDALGISTLYASPLSKADRGSSHGYDVADPRLISQELGGEQALIELAGELHRRNMTVLADVVSNHMVYSRDNRMLMDVFEHGTLSPYSNYFDINWTHPYEHMRGRLLAPFLGKFYGDCLESGELQLAFGADGFTVCYFDICFPLKIETYQTIMAPAIARAAETGHAFELTRDLTYVQDLIRDLDGIREYGRRIEQVRLIKEKLWYLYTTQPGIRTIIDETISRCNGTPGVPASYDVLDDLLSHQVFRLAFWKVGAEELNYRRFFTINSLISVRMEDEHVFEDLHAMIRRLIDQGVLAGVRIDHIDGLYDPQQYLIRLRRLLGDTFIVVEKILAEDERLPLDWPVQGTTGYDFLNRVNGVLCFTPAARQLERFYGRLTGNADPHRLAIQKKRLIIGKHLAGDVDNLALLLKRVSQHDRNARDVTMYGLRRGLVEVMAHFDVYRTYITERGVHEDDRRRIRDAARSARNEFPGLQYEIDFIERFLCLDLPEQTGEEERLRYIDFIKRFQQITGPLMAKGVEDTLFYVYNRLISLNEVGSDPDTFGTTLDAFHEFNIVRACETPHTLNATATHDTKRGEDTRARITVLSELADEWEHQVRIWRRINRRHKRRSGSAQIPLVNDEYFLYQTLIGVFPFTGADETFRLRIREYVVKAVREAKEHTAWIKPDTDYEAACQSFVDGLLHGEDNSFLSLFIPFQRKVAFYGLFNSLSQTLLKIAAPGIPDFYQGTELWDFSLVDPDNRRPVDFDRRSRMLEDIRTRECDDPAGLVDELIRTREDGRIKLFLIYRALQARRRAFDLFSHRSYIPLTAGGVYGHHVVAFARRYEKRWAVCVVPRRLSRVVAPDVLPLGDIWGDTHIVLPEEAPHSFEQVFTGHHLTVDNGRLFLKDILSGFPVALLV